MPSDEDLGATIATLREEAGTSRVELSERADIPMEEMVEIEAGRLEPTWGDLRRVAYALGIPLSELLRRAEARGLA